jgi:hypothetical protein
MEDEFQNPARGPNEMRKGKEARRNEIPAPVQLAGEDVEVVGVWLGQNLEDGDDGMSRYTVSIERGGGETSEPPRKKECPLCRCNRLCIQTSSSVSIHAGKQFSSS